MAPVAALPVRSSAMAWRGRAYPLPPASCRARPVSNRGRDVATGCSADASRSLVRLDTTGEAMSRVRPALSAIRLSAI